MKYFSRGDVVEYNKEQGMIEFVSRHVIILNLGYTIIRFDPAYACEALKLIPINNKGARQ